MWPGLSSADGKVILVAQSLLLFENKILYNSEAYAGLNSQITIFSDDSKSLRRQKTQRLINRGYSTASFITKNIPSVSSVHRVARVNELAVLMQWSFNFYDLTN